MTPVRSVSSGVEGLRSDLSLRIKNRQKGSVGGIDRIGVANGAGSIVSLLFEDGGGDGGCGCVRFREADVAGFW